MKFTRFFGLLMAAGASVLLSGCVVAPIGPRPYAVYPAQPDVYQTQPVYVEPAPVVVYPGYRHHGYRGHGYRGYRGHRYWR